MAVSGKFLADFASFSAAVQKADVELRGMETGAGKVGTSLNRMVDSFSGRKVVSEATLMVEAVDRIGGTSKLTERELARVGVTANEAAAKMKAMGLDVPPGLQKIADETKTVDTAHGSLLGSVKSVALGFAAMFTARAAMNFVGDVMKQASALKDLSQQTHINVEELQLLAASMSEFGVDADTLGKGLFTLSRKVAGGDESVTRALHMMGMSLKDVEGLQGEKLFLKMEHGLSTLQGSLRDTAASDLFGSRLGMAMAGASEGIDGALEDARRLNVVMSGESVDAMDRYGESIERAQRSLSGMAANLIGPVAEGFNVVADAAGKGVGGWNLLKATILDWNDSINKGHQSGTNLATLLDEMNRKSEEGTAKTKAHTIARGAHTAATDAQGQAAKFMAALEADASVTLDAAQRKNLAHLKDIGALNAQNATAIGVNAAQFAKYNTEMAAADVKTKALKAEADKLTAALVEMGAAGEGWRGTLDQMNPSVVEMATAYLNAGVSATALGTVFKLTDTEMKAITTSIKEQKSAIDDNAKAHEKWATAQLKASQEAGTLWSEYESLRAQQSGTATDIAIGNIERWKRDAIARMKEAGTFNEETYTAIAAVANLKLESVRVDWGALSANSRESLQQTADKARATYDAMVSKGGEFSSETIAKFWATAEEAQKVADAWDSSFTGAFMVIGQSASEAAEKMVAAANKTKVAVEGAVMAYVKLGSFDNPYAVNYSAGPEAWAAQAKKMGGSVRFDDYGNPYVHVRGENLPGSTSSVRHFAGGGSIAAGETAWVGERGPELFTPRTAGMISPHGGMTWTGDVHVHGSALASKHELAALMREALVDFSRAQGKRLGA